MPSYDYQCTTCSHVFEVTHKITEKPSLNCPQCSGAVKKLFGGGVGIVFKGSGFYKTDYAPTRGCETKSESSSACSGCSSGSHSH